MLKRKIVLLPLILAMLILGVAGCKQESKTSTEEIVVTTQPKEETKSATTEEEIYQSVLTTMSKEQYYAFLEVPERDIPILVITDYVFHDSNGKTQSIDCKVYYVWNGKVRELGTIGSTSTAYPISYDSTGIYVAGSRGITKYALDNNAKELVEVESAIETFDKKGNAMYEYFNQKKGIQTSKKSNQFDAMFRRYKKSRIVEFQIQSGTTN